MGNQQWRVSRNIVIWISVNICVIISVLSIFQLSEHQVVDISSGLFTQPAGPHTRQQRELSILSTLKKSSNHATSEILSEKDSEDQEDDQENADLQAVPACVLSAD